MQDTPTSPDFTTFAAEPLPEPKAGIHLIAAALAKAQAVMQQPVKNKTVDVVKNGVKLYTFEYADYFAIVESIRGPLAANGICFTHQVERHTGTLVLMTRLIHSSGQVLESEWPLSRSSDPKDLGGDMTYGKRYCLSALTGCVADDDLDAEPQNVASFTPRTAPPVKPVVQPRQPAPPVDQYATQAPTQPMLARLFAVAHDAGWTQEQVKLYLHARWKLETTSALNRPQYDEFVATVQTKTYIQACTGMPQISSPPSPGHAGP